MATRAVLAALRRGQAPEPDALRGFAAGLADGSVSDAQAGAFAMGVCRSGLGREGRVALTLGMRDSGKVLQWRSDRPVLDKHSTGGVGDCVSLLLAPALAACGALVPMISGRGLGHTGGTLDKLEAVPGVRVSFDADGMHRVLDAAGCAIVGATRDIAPADARLYAVRDVTSTVDHMDLITPSILSKKLAAGIDGLVLDVKVGSGAFMKTAEDARGLAHALVETANGAGCPTTALLTDMNQPLVPALGNALEVREVLGVLRGAASPLLQVAAALGGEVLHLGGLAQSPDDGAAMIRARVADGRAADVFARMIAAQGGPADVFACELGHAPVVRAVQARDAGHIASIDGEALGNAVVSLGGGRRVESDVIDPVVGMSEVVPLGQQVGRGDPLALVHAASDVAAEQAVRAVQDAITLGDAPAAVGLVQERIVA